MRIATLFALARATAHGAAVFKGKLVRNEVNGTPVAGAGVRAAGANPTDSRSPHGNFLLEFPSKETGRPKRDRDPPGVEE